MKHGDIREEKVDVIVSNSNSKLIHDEGLALALCERGGSSIQEESTNILDKFGAEIPTGNVVPTKAGSLPSKQIFHAICPIYSKSDFECPIKFKRTIGNSLQLATMF